MKLSTSAPGWRIRIQPSLSAPQIGTKYNGDTVDVINDTAGADGKWVQLADTMGFSLRDSPAAPGEGWKPIEASRQEVRLMHNLFKRRPAS